MSLAFPFRLTTPDVGARPLRAAHVIAMAAFLGVLPHATACREARDEPSLGDRDPRSALVASAPMRPGAAPPSTATGSAVTDATAPPEILRVPEPLGGPWVTCYGRFRPTSTPERDVTRLGLLCGPANGMRLVGATLTGEAADVPNEHGFIAKAGECFRVFGVADVDVPDLAVEVRDAKAVPVASDHNSDRFPILNPDGPFCLLDGGAYTLRVHARKGRGRYAMQLWRLP